MAALEVSELESSAMRVPKNARMIDRLIPHFEMSRPDSIQTAGPDRQRIHSSHLPSLFNTHDLSIRGGCIDPVANRNEAHSYRPRGRLSPFGTS